MKFLKITFAAVFAFAFGNAYAFHSGGVAECEGCHTMHNSREGISTRGFLTYLEAGPYLLQGNTQSAACLNCHESTPGSYHISTPESALHFNPQGNMTPGTYEGITQQTPGGDFAWLKSTRTIAGRGTPPAQVLFPGERQGHNIIAPDYNFVQDSTQTVAPGGTYPADQLQCSSCHDPHGKYRRLPDSTIVTTGAPISGSGSYGATPAAGMAVGVYRLLAGVGYQPKSLSGSHAFTASSPYAVAPSSYNGANTTIAGNASGASDRVAYGFGMSEWCANCHTNILRESYTSGMGGLTHPAGNDAKLTSTIAANYTAYVSSGIAGTPPDGGYSALAPFELGSSLTSDMTSFRSAPTAPDTTRNVMCLSCHRAHASAFESMARFQIGNEFMTVADGSGAAIYDSTASYVSTGYSTAAQVVAYNGRPATLFGPYARDYCNKCHNKD